MNFSKLCIIALIILIPLAIVRKNKLDETHGRCYDWALEGTPVLIKDKVFQELVSRDCERKFFRVIGIEIPTSDRVMTYKEYGQYRTDGFKEVKEFFPIW